MKNRVIQLKIKWLFVLLSALTVSKSVSAQCTWTQMTSNSFETNGVVNAIIPGSVYQNTPSTLAGCIHSGNKGLYLNIQNGYTGLMYDEEYNDLCVGRDYRFSFWTKDAWGAFNNLTFQVLSDANVILSQQNVINNGNVWQNIVMPSFTAVSGTIRFRMITNLAGGGANDVAFDDLTLSCCIPNQLAVSNATYCSPGIQIDLNNFLSPTAVAGGEWANVSPPPSGNLNNGIWSSAGLPPGTYSFNHTHFAIGNCTFNQELLSITLGDIPVADLGNDTSICEGQLLTLTPEVYDEYIWSDNSNNPTLTVSQSGTYWLSARTLGSNLITNGDFEQGNTGFTSGYTAGWGGAFGLLSIPGTFAISNSPNQVHNNFNFCEDHTIAGNQQLVVNGSGIPNTEVWCQQVIVQANTTYEFGTWVTSVENTTNVAQLQFSIDGSPLGNVFAPTLQACDWTQFTETWSSNITNSIEICIVNQNTDAAGNDFAIDDITFRPICISSDTIEVTVIQNPSVNLGADLQVCTGTTVMLDAQNPGANYLWSTLDTTQMITLTQSGNYTVTVIYGALCSSSDTINIEFEEPLSSGNDTTVNICSTIDQYDLNSLLTANSANGIWESITPGFGGILQQNGIITTNNQSGYFQFLYLLTGTVCPADTAYLSVHISQQPIAATDQWLQSCTNADEILDFSPYLVHPEEPIPGYWIIPGNLPNNAFNNPTLDCSELQEGEYAFIYVLPSDTVCSTDSTIISIDILAAPAIELGPDQFLCEQESVILDAQNPGASYSWSTTETTQTIAPNQSGSYAVTVLDSNNCWATDTINVHFEQQLFSGADSLINLCSIDTYDLSSLLNGASDGGYWQVASNSFNGFLNFDGTVIINHQTGLFQFEYIQNGTNCPSDTAIISMNIIENPVASFKPSETDLNTLLPEVEFFNTSSGNVSNFWSFGDGQFSDDINPVHAFPENEIGNYEVQLIVQNDLGCSDTATSIIHVKEFLQYYVPNCFTPDGNEFNNTFTPIFGSSIDVYDYKLEVFNRWGEIVFESKDVSVGWDGTYQGSLAKEGSYVWKIQFGLLNNDKDILLSGHVLLIR